MPLSLKEFKELEDVIYKPDFEGEVEEWKEWFVTNFSFLPHTATTGYGPLRKIIIPDRVEVRSDGECPMITHINCVGFVRQQLIIELAENDKGRPGTIMSLMEEYDEVEEAESFHGEVKQ